MKWFDSCLYHAIQISNEDETGCYKLYTGLHKVQLNKRSIKNGYLWHMLVPHGFWMTEGMIIEIDKESRDWFICCDVSWISKFPNDCEIFIARGLNII